MKVGGCFDSIRIKIDHEVEKYIAEKGAISKTNIRKIKIDTIKYFYESIKSSENLDNLPKSYKSTFLKKYRKAIDQIVKSIFKKHTITKDLQNKLDTIAVFLFSKKEFHFEKSGIVFAGYGEKEKYPNLLGFHMECLANDKLKYFADRRAEVSISNNAAISAFAQRDMVESFMEGIHPGQRLFIEKNLSRLLEHLLPEYVVNEICNGKNKQKGRIIQNKLRKIGKGILKQFDIELRKNRMDEFAFPITSSVSHLPKEELAAMAESLVNLTSFRQKISLGTSGTVGGDIDVAVISKGDGFIWIKRKHYFDPKLNPHYMAKYLKRNLKEDR